MNTNHQPFIQDILKTFQGIIPICANCKKVRDDEGFWNLEETYISKHSKAKLRNGICPACAGELFHYG